jgi:hypothetical protein
VQDDQGHLIISGEAAPVDEQGDQVAQARKWPLVLVGCAGCRSVRRRGSSGNSVKSSMGLTLAPATDVLAADGLLIRASSWARAVVPLELYVGID